MGLLKLEKSVYYEQLDRLDDALLKIDKLNISEKSAAQYVKWFTEVLNKNIAIYKSKKDNSVKDQELYSKSRGYIYMIDLGKSVGSEFQDEHFAVVLVESKYTAIIVPLTSKKEVPPHWTDETALIVDIGKITGFPTECKDCLAFVGGIRSVSKKRLSKFGDKKTKHYYDIMLTVSQMSLIVENIAQHICEKQLTMV